VSEAAASIVTLIVLLVGGAAGGWFAYAAHRRRRIVMQTSLALAALHQLNDATLKSRTYPSPIQHAWVDWASSKGQLERYKLADLLWQNLAAYEDHFEAQIQAQIVAMTADIAYREAYSSLQQDALGKSGSDRVKPSKYRRIEAKLFASQQLPSFRYAARIVCTVRYTSPQGRNSYWRSQEWDFDGLYRELMEFRRVREAKSTTQFLRQQERAKVTADVRYQVLKRDGHRCRSCGNTAEVEPLHVDHIIPIAKGGKSDLENLQTLCQSCNLGKGARH
jgi:hypothetical protein